MAKYAARAVIQKFTRLGDLFRGEWHLEWLSHGCGVSRNCYKYVHIDLED